MPARRYHLIGIGEHQMVALAIALKSNGYEVSGSDGVLSASVSQVLKEQGLTAFPDWNVNGFSKEDAVVHMQPIGADNPALKKAQALGCQVLTVAQFIEQMTADQQRIVISGKLRSLMTSIVLFVLRTYNRKYDHFTDAANDTEPAVKLSGHPIIVIDAASQLGAFTDYHHHIGVISGGDDDKIMEGFASASPKGGTLIYNADDAATNRIGSKERPDVNLIPFKVPKHEEREGKVILTEPKEAVVIQLKGQDQLLALAGAREVLKRIGITSEQFFNAIGEYLP